MAAGTWAVFNKAKKKLANGTMSITTPMKMALLQTYPSLAVSLLGSCTEITAQAGYTAGGKAISGEAWTVSSGATGTYKFDSTYVEFTASGAALSNIKAAVIYTSAASAGGYHCLCVVTLSESSFNLQSGSTLRITPATDGIFTMG